MLKKEMMEVKMMDMLSILLLLLVIVLLVLLLKSKAETKKLQEALVDMDKKLTELQAKNSAIATEQAQKMFNEWRTKELEEQKKLIFQSLESQYKARFQEWRQKEEEKIRKDAISRSTATILGRVGEQLAPLLFFTNYGINSKEVRFLGQPVDFIAFKGLEEGKVEEIVFIEVKSGRTKNLTPRERAIKRAVEEKRVSWITFHIPSEVQKMEKRVM